MPTLVLHIGTPKTGSSSIQTSLYRSASRLRSETGVLFLPPNPYRKQFPSGFLSGCFLDPEILPRILAARFTTNPDQFKIDASIYKLLLSDLICLGKPASPVPWRAFLQRKWSSFRNRPSRSAVLSSEYLWRMPVESIRELRDWFCSQGITDFRIVVYIREPVSAYKSFLQQWLRMSDDFEPYNPFVWSYDIRTNLVAWESVFGPDCLVVRPFQREHLYGQSVVSDFYRILSSVFSTPISGDVNEEYAPEDNESLSIEALTLIQELLLSVPPESRMNSAWTSSTAKFLRLLRAQQHFIKPTPMYLKPWVSALIWKRHAADLEWLSQVYGAYFSPPSTCQDTPPASQYGAHFSFGDIVEPPPDPAMVSSLKQYQLKAIFREGLK